jgi:hypothetical protein
MNTQCCSGLCQGGTCSTNSSFCHQVGDVCAQNTDCCTQNCSATGGKLGTCQANAVSGSGGCTISGTLCAGCSSCCSALCLPYGSGATSVCQVASGCHMVGDLCTKTSDCCGAPGTGLPGAGNVYCNIPSGAKIGTCHKPAGCNPEGETCHFTGTTTACGNSRNDCCGAPGVASGGVCKLDNEGIPRCYGLAKCVAAGGACSSSIDCCNGVPCIPDSMGALHCASPNDMGTTCSPAGGACTIAADCCNAGYMCVTAPGSVQGVCTAPMPPNDMGVGDMGACSLYGQGCKVTGDCCNGVQCSQAGGLGALCSGQSGCTCYNPVL